MGDGDDDDQASWAVMGPRVISRGVTVEIRGTQLWQKEAGGQAGMDKKGKRKEATDLSRDGGRDAETGSKERGSCSGRGV